MIIYNVTINIENDVQEEWLKWMREQHVPDVMATGLFTEFKICRLLHEEEQGTTYSFQYTCAALSAYEKYKAEHAPRLQAEVKKRYEGKFVAFRSLLTCAGVDSLIAALLPQNPTNHQVIKSLQNMLSDLLLKLLLPTGLTGY